MKNIIFVMFLELLISALLSLILQKERVIENELSASIVSCVGQKLNRKFVNFHSSYNSMEKQKTFPPMQNTCMQHTPHSPSGSDNHLRLCYITRVNMQFIDQIGTFLRKKSDAICNCPRTACINQTVLSKSRLRVHLHLIVMHQANVVGPCPSQLSPL